VAGRGAVVTGGSRTAARHHDAEHLANLGDTAQGREDFRARAAGTGPQLVRVAFDRAACLG
jgi:hypothetical protein